jgi:molecular chaperone HtpG
MEKGKLSVHTGNILPIIKKWLYSEKEIFVRELVSNGFDAINKLKKISLSEAIRDEESVDYAVEITVDRANGQLIFEDNGIGMTQDEIKKFITQIAFSGAEEFVKKYEESQDKTKAGIIGNFGLGFYSSFMVSNRVEIDSLSYRPGESAAYWSCEGGEEFEIGEGKREKRGTTIRLTLTDEEREHFDRGRMSEMVRKYCDFIPVPVRVDGGQVNREKPLWTKQPSSITKEDYTEFYKYLYPYQADPLFSVHINVDYPFQIQGILYFPKLAHEMDLNHSNVKIYCKQIFVTDEAQDIIPKFLTVLQGVLDLPELPLNVSRSYVQNEPQIKKIAQHIIKKVADRLNEEFKKERAGYEKMWNEIAPFVKYGMLNDERFYDQAKGSLLLEISLEGEAGNAFHTLEEYITNFGAKTDKKIYYTTDPQSQAGPMRLMKKQGIGVALMTSMIDTHFIHFLETKSSDYRFVRVDAEISDQLIDSEAASQILDADSKGINDRLIELFKKALADDAVQIRVEKLKSDDVPAIILLPEHVRRFSDMAAYMGQKMPEFPHEHTLVLNSGNRIIQHLGRTRIITDQPGPSKDEAIAKQIYFLTKLHQGGIGPEEMERGVQESLRFLESMT